MKLTVIVFLLLSGILTLTAVAQKSTTPRSNPAEALLGAAIHQEEAEGNLEAAVASYKKFLLQYGNNRPLAAKAQYRLGLAYEKLGNPEARNAYEEVVRKYADQADVAAEANRRLLLLADSKTPETLAARVLMSEFPASASVTSDGRWMAMTQVDNGGDLAVRDMVTGRVTQIFDNRGSKQNQGDYAESPILSPDRRYIAYLWYNDAGVPGAPPEADEAQIRIVSNQPRSTPRIVFRNREYTYFDPVGWSADGKSILVRTWRQDGTAEFAWVSVGSGSIQVVKSLQWRLRGLGEGALSPDGRYIVYAAWAADPGRGPMRSAGSVPPVTALYILAADGSSESTLTQTAALNEKPLWSSDGAHVLFISNASGTRDLWAAAVREGTPEGLPSLVKRDIGRIEPKAMTRSGAYYYVSQRTDIEQVFLANLSPDGKVADAGALRSFIGINPSWSPDGHSLAFSRHRPNRADYDLVLQTLETGEERIIQRNGLGAAPPRWLHHGSGLLQLAQSAINAGTNSWHVADLKTGEFKEAVTATFRATIAALSPDNKMLYTAARDPLTSNRLLDRIVAIDLATGQERLVLKLPGEPATMPGPAGIAIALSPDGRTLALLTRNPQMPARLARVGIDGKDYREIYGPYEHRNSISEKLAWTPDGRAILFATNTDGSDAGDWRIMRISAEGGTPEFTGLRVKALSSFDLSPDGSRIAFSTDSNTRRELHALDNLSSALKAKAGR